MTHARVPAQPQQALFESGSTSAEVILLSQVVGVVAAMPCGDDSGCGALALDAFAASPTNSIGSAAPLRCCHAARRFARTRISLDAGAARVLGRFFASFSPYAANARIARYAQPNGAQLSRGRRWV